MKKPSLLGRLTNRLFAALGMRKVEENARANEAIQKGSRGLRGNVGRRVPYRLTLKQRRRRKVRMQMQRVSRRANRGVRA